MAETTVQPDGQNNRSRWRGKVSLFGCGSMLSVLPGDFDKEVDWEGENGFFNDNTIKLKTIEILGMNGFTMKANAKANFESFCRGLSSNRTIEDFSINGFGPANADMFSILAPFFEHNIKLKQFKSTGLGKLSRSVVRSLGKTQSLQEVEITIGPHNHDKLAGQLISALSKNNSLLRLILEGSRTNWNGCVELAQMIKTSSSLEELNLSECQIGNQGLSVLGDALQGGTHIKSLNLGMNLAYDDGWQDFARGLHSNSSLETLMIYNSNVEDAGAAALSNAILNSKTLKTLDFGGNIDLSANGWCSFFATVLGPNSVLESLDVSVCEVVNGDQDDNYDEIALALANALANNTSMKIIDVHDFELISSEGWQTLWSSVARILFNDESLDTVCSSNHTLQQLISEDQEEEHEEEDGARNLPEKILTLLQINRDSDSKAEIVRQKIIRYFEDKSNVDELVDLDWAGVMPQALAWAGRDANGSTLMYRLIRRVPYLISLPALPITGNKRKR